MKMTTTYILGIETSCDETAAAVLDGDGRILANVVLSQLDDHRPYGGVVPEIAARSHLDHLDRLIAQAMDEAGIGFKDLAAIAATTGPGLIGGVMVGAVSAKAIALCHGLPFIAVNHLEGHALSPRLASVADGPIEFPYLLLLVSGGHCQLLAAEGVGRYRLYGRTIDDAVGEAFDKTAAMLGLGYPGGPAVEKAALEGDGSAFRFPRPMVGRDNCDFSFAGLKTAVRYAIEKLESANRQTTADAAASFQEAVADVLVDRCRRAIARFKTDFGVGPTLVVAGGVAANNRLRQALSGLTDSEGLHFLAPPMHLCTDNAAMIAWAGLERYRLGMTDPLDIKARPRWPLVELMDHANV
ncbi:MAG: tRNA (adenosine(37)-N6)-threonylcarbamoyltransferase complex transferase subunit TsaD [Alphaproteobacteria bacterium]